MLINEKKSHGSVKKKKDKARVTKGKLWMKRKKLNKKFDMKKY